MGEAADRRVFLGWDAGGWRAALTGALPDGQPAPRSSLDAAAAWLLHRFGPDLSGVVVAVPGKRAGRRLEELLVERAAADPRARALWPPEVVTAGALTDRLLQLERPAASRLLRTLIWTAALRETAPDALARIAAAPPPADDLPGWLALAEELRALHAALGAERLDFAAVAQRVARELAGPAGEAEVAHWAALAAVQQLYRRRLAALGCGDPHDLRGEAIEAGRLDRSRRVVLVGVVETSGLLRAVVDGLGPLVESLVFAPAERAADFDERGGVRAERWAAAPVPLPSAAWCVADGPAEQAAVVVETLARWQERHAVDGVTLGVPDTEVVPYLRARLAEHGIPVRDAQGLELLRTPLLRTLGALASFLERGRFDDLAALLREPPIEAWLGARPSLAGRDLPARLDAYQADHLPDRVPQEWLGDASDAAPLRQLQAELATLLAELGDGQRRPLRLWPAPIAALLARLVAAPPRERDRAHAAEREQALLDTLEPLRDGLLELASLPATLDDSTTVGAGAALHALMRALAGQAVPPSGGEPAIELLGWLELPLDDAPLILTGFNEGRVPEPVGGPSLLRDELRRRLGLPGDEARQARDAYFLCTLAASGRELALITGRRTAAGDPLLPSRLLFHCPDPEVPARLARWLPRDDEELAAAAAPPPAPLAPPRRPPLRPPAAPVTSMRVTSFKLWLQSPYRFYLECVEKLESHVDERELSPLAFGSLVHQVLEDFGRDERARVLTDAAAIERVLLARLAARVAESYGATALPAVAVQIEQLRRRLAGFAQWQARRVQEGWRIHAVEWQPPSGELPFVVDGQPMGLRGRIDRIDRHLDGRWAILDYKTGDGEAKYSRPDKMHRRGDGTWKDLQLPLYGKLAEPLAAAEGWTRAPELGYVVLPRDPLETGALMAEWTVDDLASAWDEAARVVREVRAGNFEGLGDFPDEPPVLAWIAGRGLLAGDLEREPADGDDEGADDGNGGNGDGA